MKLILILLTVLSLSLAYGQEKSKTQNTQYFYTVENVSSENQLNKAYSELESLEFVTKVKLNYKPENKGKAQFIVFVSEPIRTTENQKMFEITDLKSIILSNDLEPIELTIEKL